MIMSILTQRKVFNRLAGFYQVKYQIIICTKKFNACRKSRNEKIKIIGLLSSPERSRTAVSGSRAQKDCHYPTGLYNYF